tara:strand:+ start:95 stop:1849 length:1755 start_codon:yes stop_codon:yes gene_type:complete
MSSNIKRKLAAIMFTDIAGYTALSSIDETKALKLLDKQDEILTPIIEEFNGTLHKEMGDGLLLTFPSVTEAINCGIKIQKETKNIKDLNLRIGIHEGEITLRDGDALGDDVNIASRIESYAAEGGIAISGKVQQNISSIPEFKTKFISQPNLKGVKQDVKIYCLVSHDLPETDITKVTAKLEKDVKKLGLNQKSIMATIGVIGVLIVGLIIWLSRDNIKIDNKIGNDSKNFYFDITSSPNYVDYYYQDWGYGSHHYYPEDQYIINTIDESLVSEIRDYVFRALSAKYANQKINIDASFEKEDQDPLNEIAFPKNHYPTDEEMEKSKLYIDIVKNNLSKRFDYYENGRADGFMRAFIYKGIDKNVGKDSTFYILDFEFTNNSSNSWSAHTDNTDLLVESSPTLSSDISKVIVNYFSSSINGILHDGVRIGEVVEVLSKDIAKIKLYEPGSVKKRMMLSTKRIYHWLNGGAELKIKDLEFVINFFKEGGEENLRKAWIHFDLEGEFDLEKAKEISLDNESMLKSEIEKINQNLNSGFYGEGTTTIGSQLSYYLEVLSVKDSIVTAKVVGSNSPMYYIRVGDLVEIK